MADLTTVTAVKAYLAETSNGQDSLIASLIARESRSIEMFTGRRFPDVTHTKRQNGTGTATLCLPESPIISVASLEVGGTTIAESADGIVAGYLFDDIALNLVGSKFPAGRQNVACTWTAGYETSESGTVPSANTPTLTPTTGGRAVTDLGVENETTGAALALTTGNLSTGQYSFANGVYTFASADANASVAMTYRYIPAPIEQACIDLVSQDLKTRSNIGIRSKSLAGETISYASDGMSTGVQQTLKMFKRFYPA